MKTFLDEIGKGIADMMQALVRKDLREPANLQALLDTVKWAALIALCTIPFLANRDPLSMFRMALIFTFVSIGWCIYHYTILRSRRRR